MNNLDFLRKAKDESYDLIYIDPPFNTGKRQQRTRISVNQDNDGKRVGFGGKKYSSISLGTTGFDDTFDDFLEFIGPRLEETYRILKSDGSFFLHIDYREVHYCKVLLDSIFGRECFMNEIVWAYDFGGKSKTKWSAKHDNILWYVKNPNIYTFNFEKIARIPYMAPGLAGQEKAAKGKIVTDTWWHTIVPTNGKERTGYATQKPLGVLQRIIDVHTNPGDSVLDYFAGSGTTGEAALKAGCSVDLVDENEEAIKIMCSRLPFYEDKVAKSL